MKKVTSFLVLAAALLVAGNAHAQLGINIGYAPDNITTTTKNSNSNLPMTGFFAGVNYNHALSGNIGISFGAQLRYNTKKSTTKAKEKAKSKKTKVKERKPKTSTQNVNTGVRSVRNRKK